MDIQNFILTEESYTSENFKEIVYYYIPSFRIAKDISPPRLLDSLILYLWNSQIKIPEEIEKFIRKAYKQLNTTGCFDWYIS